MSDDKPNPSIHAEWLPNGGLKVDIDRPSAWQVFGLIGVLQMQAEMMQLQETQMAQHTARKVIVPPPGLKVGN